MKKWSASAYAFFHPIPAIEYCHRRKCHVFSCAAKGCKQSIARYLDTTDKESMGNMHKHIRSCWGSDVLDMADNVENLENARKIVKAHHNNGMITSMFQHLKGKGAVTYSHHAHTKSETCTEIVRWVSESLHPFNIMKDCGFTCLMKTGWPMYYLSHPTMVSHDVKTVFAKTCQHIAKLLQEYDGELNFATDAWTSPNHQAFVVFMVHFIHDGQPVIATYCLIG
ncbi:hypothetical protein ARMSODRAFT_988749 [Armillaria solidipes]|uniref:DUF659 domain-containing protein n=1 Tax=Armillaria solidipes TaxID=1076256 RepID=A0A2H3BMF6_9AGAR|nr:hypothetical protein ARMSODRAFT_988749 [Armillaria solidipes]